MINRASFIFTEFGLGGFNKGVDEEGKKKDYGAGIRTKKLKEGNLIDWHRGMDIDSEFTDSEEEREREKMEEVKRQEKQRENEKDEEREREWLRAKEEVKERVEMGRKKRVMERELAKKGPLEEAKASPGVFTTPTFPMKKKGFGLILGMKKKQLLKPPLDKTAQKKKKKILFKKPDPKKEKKEKELESREKKKKKIRRRELDIEDFDKDTQLYRNLRMIQESQTKDRIIRSLKSQGTLGSIIFLITSILLAVLATTCFQIWSTMTKLEISKDLQGFATLDYAVTMRMADIANMVSRLNDIGLMNEGTDFTYNPKSRVLFHGKNNLEIIKNNMDSIKVSLGSFERFNKQIQESITQISLGSNMTDFSNKKNIPMYRGWTPENFSINEVMKQWAATTVNILELAPQAIGFTHPDVMYIIDNVLVNINNGMGNFSEYTNLIKQQALFKQEVNLVYTQYVIVSVGAIFTVLFYFGVYYYYKQKETIVSSFYGFNPEQIDRVCKKLNRFLELIQFAQISEDQFDMTLSEESSEDDSLKPLYGGHSRSKIAVNLSVGRSRRRNRKGTLIPVFGVFRLVLICPLLICLTALYLTTLSQNEVVDKSAKLMSTVENIAITENINYATIASMEVTLYKFVIYDNHFNMIKIMDFYSKLAGTTNENALMVNF